MADPDFIYDPDDWEITHDYADRSSLVENIDLDSGGIKRFATLIKGPPRYAVKVVVTRDDAGDPDETEIRWFENEADARAAAGWPIADLFARQS